MSDKSRSSRSTRVVSAAEAGRGTPRAVWIVIVLLSGATAAAYWRLPGNGFVNFDDRTYVFSNPHIAGGLTWPGIKWCFTSFYAANWHPITWLSHMVDVSIFGMKPAGHHMVNLLLHIANCIMLFGLLRRVTGRMWESAFVAALFALHPLHVESVAWAAERKDVLSTFFWMATIWAYVGYAAKPRLSRYLVVLALFALGLMAKPMLVSLPFVLLLLDYWPLARLTSARPTLRRLIAQKVPLLVMAAASSMLTVAAQKTALASLDSIDIQTRAANAVVSVGRYMTQMLWPAGLAVYYPYTGGSLLATAALVLVVLLALTIAVLALGREYPYLPVGWFWYLVTLAPVIGIVQVGGQSHADRYAYIPLIGLFICIAFGIGHFLASRPRLQRPAWAGAAILLVLAGLVTQRQVGYWRDSATLYTRAMGVTRGNSVMMTNLAMVLMDSGSSDDAITRLRAAVEASPGDAVAASALGDALGQQGRYEESMVWLQKAVQLDPDGKVAQVSLGKGYIRLRRFEDAQVHLRRAMEIDPHCAEAWAQLGVVLQHTGRLDDAIDASRRAVELEPGDVAGHVALAGALLKKGDIAGAADEYKRCVSITPEFATYFNLAGCLRKLGRLAEAEQAYREALRLKPDSAQAHYNMGVLLADMGRPEEAAAQMKAVLSIDPRNEDALDALRQLEAGRLR
jgi:protein O-mannosyl-transferase